MLPLDDVAEIIIEVVDDGLLDAKISNPVRDPVLRNNRKGIGREGGSDVG